MGDRRGAGVVDDLRGILAGDRGPDQPLLQVRHHIGIECFTGAARDVLDSARDRIEMFGRQATVTGVASEHR
ncbi:hypothetical protein [Williamsia herbipolensis]|uniref:hypothetical protein n=1 Tax=Williamsia herbipolensis TaxID=1603258 RepID=UPI002E2C6BE6|nr:hypothetical protein [Williamsia herbipolensis]